MLGRPALGLYQQVLGDCLDGLMCVISKRETGVVTFRSGIFSLRFAAMAEV